MVTRTQIDKLGFRIEQLAEKLKPRREVWLRRIVWPVDDQTDEQFIEKDLSEHPQHRDARLCLIKRVVLTPGRDGVGCTL
jgi:hypothetical protein